MKVWLIGAGAVLILAGVARAQRALPAVEHERIENQETESCAKFKTRPAAAALRMHSKGHRAPYE